MICVSLLAVMLRRMQTCAWSRPCDLDIAWHAGDILQFGAPETAEKYKVKMYHRSERDRLERAFSLSDANGSEPNAANTEAVLASK